ncbi:MAG: hypothetical protein EOP24_26255 [Hyphomicrobiales bacterium]|nr:MAG: hypothetical protein EOP24_26255 [Hyphomicrobiales bacterium]
MAELLAFGSVIGLKALVVVLIFSIPAAALMIWRSERDLLMAAVAGFTSPIAIAAIWAVLVLSIRGLQWVFS